MSREKLLYKAYVDDMDSSSYEEYLEKRLIAALDTLDELHQELHRKSVKYSATLERDEKIKFAYHTALIEVKRMLTYNLNDKALAHLKQILGDSE